MDFQSAQTKGSLYTREALYRQTVRLKGVTHYILRSKMYKRSTNKLSVLLLLFRQVKPALWWVPLSAPFLLLKRKGDLKKSPARRYRYAFMRSIFCSSKPMMSRESESALSEALEFSNSRMSLMVSFMFMVEP